MTDTTTPASAEGLRPVTVTILSRDDQEHTPEEAVHKLLAYMQGLGVIPGWSPAPSASPASGEAVANAEPVAWTDQSILDCLVNGSLDQGWLWPTFDEMHSLALYTASAIAAAVEQATAGMRRKLIEAEEDAKCSREFLEVADRRFQVALRQLFDERTARIEAERRVEAMQAKYDAAATDMLEALHQAHDFLDRNGNGWDEVETLRLIRAAIAKAEDPSR